MTASRISEQALSRQRRRDLAGNRRAGRWPRRITALAHRRFIRAHWRQMCVPPLFALLCFPVLRLVLGERSDFAAGALFASAVWLPVFYMFLGSGTELVVMAEAAEQWTAQDLRKLQRRGWRLLNSVVLDYGDVDHIAIGPAGVVVLETKWTTRYSEPGREPDQAWLHDAARKTAESAVRIKGMLANIASALTAYPCVVVWGPGSSKLASFDVDHRKLTVPVFCGLSLPAWVRSLPGDALTPAEIDEAYVRLERHVERRDRADLANQGPEPRSLEGWYFQVCAGLVSAWVGALACLQVGQWLGRWTFFALSTATLIGLGLIARRWRPLRSAATGWTIGVGVVSIFVLVRVVTVLVRG